MQYHRKKFNPEDLDDKLMVKSYLDYSFKYRRTKKNFLLYINMRIIFSRYPKTIKKILDEISLLGYYKDYFYVLMFSRNETVDIALDDYIYGIIVNQLNSDLNNLKVKKKISTLGKWLPREKSNINIRCSFVDKFNKIFFPDIIDINSARRKYRKMKTMLNAELGTIESKLCTKQFGAINYHKVAPYALSRSMKTIQKNQEAKLKYDEYVIDLLKNMSLSELTKEIMLKKYDTVVLEKIWQNFKSPFDKYLNNAVCIIDLSNDIYAGKSDFLTIGIALLVDSKSRINKKIFVGNNLINLSGDLQNKIQQMQKHVGSCEIDPKNYDFGEDIQYILIVTTKEINYHNNPKILHVIPDHDKYTILHYKSYKKIIPKMDHYINNIKKKTIKTITNSSNELKDSPIYVILMLGIIFLLINFFPSWSVIIL